MSGAIISVENLGKCYQVGHQVKRERYVALRDVLGRNVRNAARKTADLLRGRPIVQGDDIEEFWALRNVSFEVERGEVVGIIGRNGAGKSTLLKILSRITEPSEGRVRLRGRVASLLEVGTGFHPELTGRENIFLNGAILGMRRAEIARKFDEIVAFAEVEKFLDTPVKRYSSGMYVRLAFAVAAHLEPEILVVDEVLAVGDAEFQKKCLGKMSEVAGGGRTVLFVSHNAGAVRSMCSRALLLRDGRVARIGATPDVLAFYANSAATVSDRDVDLTSAKRRGSGAVRIEMIRVAGDGPIHFNVFERAKISFCLSAGDPDAMASANVWMLFRNASDEDVMMIMQKDADCVLPRSTRAEVALATNVDLRPGRYQVACGVLNARNDILDWVDGAFTCEVESLFDAGGGFDARPGLTTKRADWSTQSQSCAAKSANLTTA